MPSDELESLIIKSIALLITATSVHLSLSPPNPPVKQQECARTSTIFERLIQWITFSSKAMVWLGASWDISISATSYFIYHVALSSRPVNPAALSCFLSTRSCTMPELWTVYPTMFIGAFATLAAAVLRTWCFRTLGPLFTFEVTIRPQHELIMHGPYSWVRHPSYTGIYLTLFGATAVLCSPGSWLSMGGWSTIGAFPLVFFWVAKCLYVFRGTSLRLKAEDDMLRDTFGATWEEYARKVPYRLIPFVF
ncbi:hypothetical protein AMATHDRAFT_80175 [Amanita thiersii Skay4041]|uniref:Protein-S-isoprenylcysteine O-methyltransferase n=1 Tax=Amanita thiersii Skay4041 TaxID=703135 RepID=A0A2A9NTI4_9AGAR|nr:hypothetical protein AMATHDRAFT_80175 [Amanita thiersii Skay4041]